MEDSKLVIHYVTDVTDVKLLDEVAMMYATNSIDGLSYIRMICFDYKPVVL